jgi:hypothetical protein
MQDRNIEEYKWNNRTDVDITLTYITNTIPNTIFTGRSSLVLEYAYVDDIKKKLALKSHLY